MQTGMPAARNGRAMSSARGYWLDCTPTSPTSARPPRRAEVADDLRRKNAAVGLVVGLDGEVDARAEDLALARVLRQAVHAGERVGRQRRAEPLNRIAPIVVVGRLDQDEGEAGDPAGEADGVVSLSVLIMRLRRERKTCRALSRTSGTGNPRNGGPVGGRIAAQSGGTRPSWPTITRTASSAPSLAFAPRATIAAPGLRSARAPGANATTGALGSTSMTCCPPL